MHRMRMKMKFESRVLLDDAGRHTTILLSLAHRGHSHANDLEVQLKGLSALPRCPISWPFLHPQLYEPYKVPKMKHILRCLGQKLVVDVLHVLLGPHLEFLHLP